MGFVQAENSGGSRAIALGGCQSPPDNVRSGRVYGCPIGTNCRKFLPLRKRTKGTKDSENLFTCQFLNFVLFATSVVEHLFRLWLR